VELPCIEIGFGARHNEDLTLITVTGHDSLHTREEPLLVS
jgi:hypothetical protein